jgi:hypothetical protein
MSKTWLVTYPFGIIRCRIVAEDDKFVWVVPPVDSGQKVAIVDKMWCHPKFTEPKDVAHIASLRLSQADYDEVVTALEPC